MLVKDRYFKGRNQPKGEIGIEIEIEGRRLHTAGIPDIWSVTHDGSLRGEENLELVLKQPIPRGMVAKALNEIDAHFDENNAIIIPSVRTGVHIHVNVQELTMEQAFIFQLMWLLFETPMVSYCGEDRTGNLFCLRSSDAETIIDKLHEAVRKNDFKTLYTDELRYGAMNPKALCEYGSLEFRCLKTPNRAIEIHQWVQLLLKLKDYALHLKNPQELISRISLEGADAIADEVFGELLPILVVEDWTEVLYDSLRRIQPIVFARDWEASAELDGILFKAELPQDVHEAKRKGALTAREVVDYAA